MIQKLSVVDFVFRSENHCIIDVRSAREYQKGHILHAHNIPLFSDDERSFIGTLYKEKGKEQALLQGLDFIGPKCSSFIRTVKKITDQKIVLVYCSRGGMRSHSFAWLLHLFGYTVYVLQNGYKSYRKFVVQQFERSFYLVVVSGKTGTGKTELLEEYLQEKKQIINLEALAQHKGSVFGGIGQIQPTQEQFENNLALVLFSLDADLPVWIEDESRHIGKVVIPENLWRQMSCTRVIEVIEKRIEERIEYLLKNYESCTNDELKIAVQKLEKKLGLQRCLQAQELLDGNKRVEFCVLMLEYYDKAYEFSFEKRKNRMECDYS